MNRMRHIKLFENYAVTDAEMMALVHDVAGGCASLSGALVILEKSIAEPTAEQSKIIDLMKQRLKRMNEDFDYLYSKIKDRPIK